MPHPTVSIIMSVYNGANTLRAALQSICDQTYTDFEFLIIDDASVDESADMLKVFAHKDNRIQVITHTKNRGLTNGLNELLGKACGTYIARMDADDIAHPMRLEKQVAYLDAHPSVGLVGTWYEEIDAHGRIMGVKKFPTDNISLQKNLIVYNPFFHASVLMRHACIVEVGGYSSEIHKAQDYDLWMRIARVAQLHNIGEFLMQRRYSEHMISRTSENAQIRAALHIRKQAIVSGQYPFWCAVYLIRPWIVLHTPYGLKKFIREKFLASKLYA